MNVLETKSLSLFIEVLRIRRIEERIADRYAEQEMRCPVHLSIGQEAVAVGLARGLSKSDKMIANHRAHAHYLAKGGDLKKMIAEIYGKKTGCCSGRGGSMHLVDLEAQFLGCTPIVGGSLPVGVGISFGSHLKKEKDITAVIFGDGATEEGVWMESLNFAALKKLPVLFVCENNFYSVCSPFSVRQSDKRDRLKIAEAHGIWAKKTDGNDVDAVLDLTKEAAERIRSGDGPCFVEFETYRLREHCGPNFDTELLYRSMDEYNHWNDKCPVKIYKEKLLSSGELTEERFKEIDQTIEKEIDEAFLFAKNSPFPSIQSENQLFKE